MTVTVSTRFPTANEGAGLSGGQWNNPSNAHADDGVDATTTDTSLSSSETRTVGNNWLTFGFDDLIPSEATITAVKVIVEWGVAGQGTDVLSRLLTQFVIRGVDQGQLNTAPGSTYPTVDVLDHTGVRVWVPADLLDANFKVQVAAEAANSGLGSEQSGAFQLDYVKVEVTHVGGQHAVGVWGDALDSPLPTPGPFVKAPPWTERP